MGDTAARMTEANVKIVPDALEEEGSKLSVWVTCKIVAPCLGAERCIGSLIVGCMVARVVRSDMYVYLPWHMQIQGWV